MKRILAFISLVALFSACSKKEFPEKTVRSQAFVISGLIDGEEFNLSPGTNGLFLYTDVDSNEDGSHLYSAHVAAEDGNNDLGELIFELHAWEEEGTSAEFLNQLTLGELSLGNDGFDAAVINYQTSADNIVNFQFSVNDESSSEQEGELLLSGSQELNLTLQQEVEGVACIRTGQYNFDPSFRCFSSFESSTTEIIIAEDEITIFPPLVPDNAILIWDFGSIEIDNNQTIGNTPFVLEQSDQGLFQNYTVDVFYEGDLLVNINETIFYVTNSTCEFPSVDFEKRFIAESVFNITYIQPDGEVYKSLLPCEFTLIQPESAFVDLASIEEYERNENGLPTKRVTLNGNLSLFEEVLMDDVINIEFEDLSIAFPYSE